MPLSQRHSALAKIRARLDTETETEHVPSESIERHYKNLERLAGSLRALGLNEEQIDAQVLEVFEEYQQRLSDYIIERQGRARA